MKFKTALNGFKHTSASILADGKVDMDEARMLKEFIYPYVLQGNEKFVEFNRLIEQYMEDGQITKEESDELVELIEDITRFLKIDNYVNIGILTFVFVSIAGMAVVGILM